MFNKQQTPENNNAYFLNVIHTLYTEALAPSHEPR